MRNDSQVTLFQPPPVWGLPSMSPFCAKLEAYFRMAAIPYKTAPGNPMAAPKGKIPYVKVDGKVMGDSGLVIDYLKKTRGDPLDAHLTDEQRALALSVRRLVEEHLYFCGAGLRWGEEVSFAHVRKVFRAILPPVIGGLILKKIRKDFLASVEAQGVGRHSPDEILALAAEDLRAVSVLLGDKAFFFGEKPSSIDAVLYGFLIQFLWVPWESELTRAAKGFPNLEPFCSRMKQRYWA